MSRLLSGKTRYLVPLIMMIGVILIAGVNPMRQTLAPMDILLAYPGWSSFEGSPPVVNPERSDVLDQRLPLWRYFRSEIRSGTLPLWTPIHQLGAPGIQFLPFEGLNIPFWIFVLTPDEATGYTLAVLSSFAIAAWGSYLLLFFMFGNRWAALFGGITFAFSGFNVAWAHWPHLSTASLIPWVLASQLRYWQTGMTRWALAFAVSVALLSVGGFPFVTLVGVIAGILLSAVLLVADWNLRRFVGLLVAGLAGASLTLPAIYQFAEFLQQTDLSYRTGGTGLRLDDLSHLIGVDVGTRISVERTFFAGTLAAAFSVASYFLVLFRPNRYAIFGALVAFFVLCTAYGLAPAFLVEKIPGFSMNPWSRAGVLVGLSFAVLSAYFLSHLLRGSWLNKNWLITSIVLAGVFGIQTWQLHQQFTLYNSRPPKETYFPPTPTLSYVSQHLLPFQSAVADASFVVSGTIGNYGIPEFLAHGFRTPGQRDVIDDIVRDPFTTPTASLFGCERIDPFSKAADFAGVRYFLIAGPCEITDEMVHHRLENGIFIVENPEVTGSGYYLAELSEDATPDYSSLTLTKHSITNFAFSYHGTMPGWVVVPFRYAPSWRITVNGAEVPVELLFGVFPAVEVDGSASIEYSFIDDDLGKMSAVGFAGFGVCLFALFAVDRRKRGQGAAPS